MAAHNQHVDPRRAGHAKLINIYASIPHMTRGKPLLIGGDPKGKNILYCTGNSVVVRNVKEPLIADTYTDHPKAPTVARYCPSGFYIASGDEMGNVRIWDTTQAGTYGIKLDQRALSGRVYDIAWTEDSKRVVAVGDGREKYGAAFFMDGGASVGEITGHSKIITSVDIKQTRPFRLMTGSEDLSLGWFEGPPFKWKKSVDGHSRFVNCVRFSPDGERVVSVGQDKLALIFDGKTGDKVGQLNAEHNGGIYCVSWAPTSKQVLTASADRTCKVWDVETGAAVSTFEFGAGVEDQQLGCIWQGGDLLSIGLNGYLNYLDPNSGKLIKSIHGHMNFITSLAHDGSSDSFYSGSYDSSQIRWSIKDASTSIYLGAGHTNQISALAVDGSSVYSAGMDDCFGVAPLGEGQTGARIATDSPARGIATNTHNKGLAVGISMKSVSLIRGSVAVAKVAVSWSPTSVALSADGQSAAVGGEDQKVHIFKIAGDTLTEATALAGHTREVSAVAYSPDGKFLASACKNRSIILWDAKTHAQIVNGQWCFHTSTINSLAFSPDSLFLASASLDQDIYIWNPAKVMQKLRIPLAHRGGVNQVLWLNNNQIATGGQDCCIKTWSVDRAAFA